MALQFAITTDAAKSSSNFYVKSLEAAFGLDGNDSFTAYAPATTYKDGSYWTLPAVLSGGQGDDKYYISATADNSVVIADAGSGNDYLRIDSSLDYIQWSAKIDGRHFLARFTNPYTYKTCDLFIIDAFRSSGSIERTEFNGSVILDTSYNSLQSLVTSSGIPFENLTWDQAIRKGYFNLSVFGASNDAAGAADLIDLIYKNGDPSYTTDTSAPTYNVSNTYAINLVGDVLTGSPKLTQNSYDAKFYNLGGGRYGVQQKGKSTIDEITGATTLQFQDQTIFLYSDVAATFNQVKGIDDVSGVVFRLYNAAFARLPDAKGLENWINGNKSGGQTYSSSALEFAKSQEFKNRYGSNVSDTQYVNTLYNNVLGRTADAGGLAHYQGLLASGRDRGSLLLDFSESPENRVLFTKTTGLS